MIYDYIITKPPLNEDTLEHYGVKGMKWKKRKAKVKKKSKKQQEEYYAKKMADDVADGRRQNRAGRVELSKPGNPDKSVYSPKIDNKPGRDFINSSRVQTNTRYEDPNQGKIDKFMNGTRHVQKTYETSRDSFEKALDSNYKRKKKK